MAVKPALAATSPQFLCTQVHTVQRTRHGLEIAEKRTGWEKRCDAGAKPRG
ncbi:hypothetical protein TRIUR3_03948 [Triticum urartu]|uniref:Uncharacterized protein n=1 Tax=Triticum urartu TaxID=4572 RepID=M7ZBR1_TRIUA|nr:hypothetical protein TRIUR3_03948 [Triticum urartu]